MRIVESRRYTQIPPQMSEHNIRLTRRRLLGGILAVGGASAATGAGTIAYFSDTETSTGNSISAGTLNLTLNGDDQTVTFLDATNVSPGQNSNGSGSVTLGNTGTLSGDVEIELTAIRSNENGYYGTENGNADTSPNDGELDEYLEIEGRLGSTTVWSRKKVVDLTEGDVYNPGVTLDPSQALDFTLEWWLPNANNDAQSDSVELDLTFQLTQQGGGA